MVDQASLTDLAQAAPAGLAESTETIRRVSIRRHAIVVRITHWINVLCLTILLMSGLQIFNAHPALYWGQQADFDHPIVALKAAEGDDTKGVTVIAGHTFNTTGFLGVSSEGSGEPAERGFPSFMTIPGYQDLGTGRHWHFFFAWLFVINGLAYLTYSIWSRHISRDLWPSRRDLRDIPHSIWNHMRLKFPRGQDAKHYNVLQKLSYAGVVLVLLPVMVLAGLTMSPGLDTAFPFLLQIFGGRQSARTIHFVIAWTLVLFVFVHVVMVLLSGVINNLRSMVTGRYIIDEEKSRHVD